MRKKDKKEMLRNIQLIQRLEGEAGALRLQMRILKTSLETAKEKVAEPDPLLRIANRNTNGTLGGHLLTAETFGSLVERFLVVEKIVKGEKNA